MRNATILVIDLLTSPEEFLNSSSGLIRGPPEPTHTVDCSEMSLLHRPQQVLVRRLLFQVHLWTGLVTALYAIFIGMTGSSCMSTWVRVTP